jgi:hypothetical protein
MFRVAVTYCLVLSTAAGPWLCCCALSRMGDARHLVQSFLGIAGGEHWGCSGCCGHSHLPGRGLPGDPAAPGPATPGECPCRAFTPAYAVVPPKPVESAELPGERLADTGLCPTTYCLLPSASTSDLRDRDTAPRTGDPRDLLAVLQTLRC